MKKIMCVALVLALCLGATAFATVPSRETNNMLGINVPFTGASFDDIAFPGMEAIAAKLDAFINENILKLWEDIRATTSVERKNDLIDDFFGVKIEDMMVGNGEMSIIDILPGFAHNFPKAVGDETFEMELQFDTLFVPGTQVVVGIGLMDSSNKINWRYFIVTVNQAGDVVIVVPLRLMNEIEETGSVVATVTYSSNIVKKSEAVR